MQYNIHSENRIEKGNVKPANDYLRRFYMKRLYAILLAVFLLTAMLPGCEQISSNDTVSIVCTVFPQYDWVRQILGDKAESFNMTLLLDKRIDLHNYQPSVDDIVKIATCDLFIYVGGDSDEWVKGVLREAKNKDMVVINMLDTLGHATKQEEIIEGMETDGYGDEDGYDEHVWLSLKNARIFCEAITEALVSIDEENAGEFRRNLAAYSEKLSILDTEYQKAVDASLTRTLLFGDRFPFRYLTDDYGLNYYAAFAGCSAETGASFATVVFLAQKMDELELPCVMVTESSDQTIARTVIQNTKARNYSICVLDAMQSVSSSDIQNGVTYLSIMERNLETLKEALK